MDRSNPVPVKFSSETWRTSKRASERASERTDELSVSVKVSASGRERRPSPSEHIRNSPTGTPRHAKFRF